MPKTNDKDAYYFPHDCNARNDPKVLALRSVYGAEGYGVYFMLVEILREQPDYKLQVTKYLYHALAMQMQIDASTLQKIVDDCCNEFTDGDDNTLLINDGEYLFSASLLRRMERVDDISRLRKEAAQKRWKDLKDQPCKDLSKDDGCNEDANALQKQSKGEQSRADQSRPEQTRAEQSRPKQSKVDIFAVFANGDEELLSTLRDFNEMRVKIKKPMTDRAKKLLLTELEKLSRDRGEQIAILNQSIASSWAGVFALKEQSGRGSKNENSNVFLEMLRERNGQG